MAHGWLPLGRALAIAAGMLACPLAAQVAQTATAAPPTRAEVERLPTAPAARRPGRLTVSDNIERAPCPLEDARFASVTIQLDRVVFAHLEQVDVADLDAVAAPFLGHRVPIAAICQIRDSAATLLRSRGYLAAIQIPPQKIEGGSVELDVLMAHLIAVHVRGDVGHAQARLAGFLERLKAPGPFNQHLAERALLLAGDLPGFDVHLTLRSANTVPGEVVGDVSVARIPFAVDANVQNLGSQAVGRWSGLINVEANDVLGIGDRAIVGIYSTADPREQTVYQGSYGFGIGSSGLTVAGRFTYARTRPDTGASTPFRARTTIATGEAVYPLLRRQDATFRLAAGLDAVDQRLTFGGLPFTEDHLRTVYTRLDFSLSAPTGIGTEAETGATDPPWRVAGSVELRHGLASLGASRVCGPAPFYIGCAIAPSISRLNADPQAGLVRYSGSIAVSLLPHLTLHTNTRAQFAFAPLLSFEQYTAGNYTIGRGYDPGVLSGDNGVGTQFEARLGPFAVPAVQGIAVEPFAFLDVARIWFRGTPANVYDRTSIATIGLGTRVALRNRAQLEVLLAAPVGAPPLAGRDQGLRLLINLNGHFDAIGK